MVEPQPGAPEVLRAEGLRVSYPVPIPGMRGWFRSGSFVALASADFAIPAGTTLGVVGESGSGKSTLALAALGLLPHEGRLRVADTEWQQAKAEGEGKSAAPSGAGGVPGPVFVAVAAHDGRADRGGGPEHPRAGTERGCNAVNGSPRRWPTSA